MRLQKYLAECGIASRRKSQEIIEQGRVKVNEKVIVDKSFKVSNDDIVTFDGKRLIIADKVYIVLNKPAGYICEHNDKFKRHSVYDLVKLNNVRLFSIGRLDYNSSGLLILTNDGDFANKVMHPSGNIIKVYSVESLESIPEILIKSFKKGILIDNIKYKAVEVTRITSNKLCISLHEGKKREIREVFKHFKINIKSLQRISIGNLSIDNLKIEEGNYKIFSRDELSDLIGLK
jgi:23S rRNA pseudouridine2605 synthase